MSGLASRLFGSNASTPTKSNAVKWLGMRPSTNEMFVDSDTSSKVLDELNDSLINLISIFGAARQGKSFLMNLLADQQDLFKISNLREPCTQGVDLSGHFLPLSTFSSLNNCPPVRQNGQIQIGFVDAEGQGDRDISYDSRLVSPVLLSSKVVLFNWKDSLQADRILNLLAVLARAAQGIESDGDTKIFGHLHIVFRDWNFVDSTPDEVYQDLFRKEKGRSDEVNTRNLARSSLEEAFSSITVWLFPPPVANTANLRDKIRFEQLQPLFQGKLKELRMTLSKQLQEPMIFNKQPLTARMLSLMIPKLVEILNSDQVVLPQSIYASMVRDALLKVKGDCEKNITEYCQRYQKEETAAKSSDLLQKILQRELEKILTAAVELMRGAPTSSIEEITLQLREYMHKEIQVTLQANKAKIVQKIAVELDATITTLQKISSVIEHEKLPMRRDQLKISWREYLDKEIQRLDALPFGSDGQACVKQEITRVQQHAGTLLEKLELLNDRALEQANTSLQNHLRESKIRLKKQTDSLLESYVTNKRPIAFANLQKELHAVYDQLLRSILQLPVASCSAFDVQGELELHKNQVEDELHRRYYLEVRQIVSDSTYQAKENLTIDVAKRLDSKLPVNSRDEITGQVDQAVEHVKRKMYEQLKGWTILKTDLKAKTAELEQRGDDLTNEYLRKNQEKLEQARDAQNNKAYNALLDRVSSEYEKKLNSMNFPVRNDIIDSILQDLINDTIKSSKSPLSWAQQLLNDLQSAVAYQKKLNRLAQEKQDALIAAESEKKKLEEIHTSYKKRELEAFAAQKEAEIIREQERMKAEALLSEFSQKDALQTREYHAMKQRLEEMQFEREKLKREHYESQQKVLAGQERQEEAARLKQLLNEKEMQFSVLESEKQRWEAMAREEAFKREEAVKAAQQAADAAAVSARAALEAAAEERSPPPAKRVKAIPKSNNRKLGIEDEDGDVSMFGYDNGSDYSAGRPSSTNTNKSALAQAKANQQKRRAKLAAATSSSGMKADTPTNPRDSAVVAARKAAQDALAERIAQRTSNMKTKKKGDKRKST